MKLSIEQSELLEFIRKGGTVRLTASTRKPQYIRHDKHGNNVNCHTAALNLIDKKLISASAIGEKVVLKAKRELALSE